MIELRHTPETRIAYDEIFTGEAIHQMDSFFIWILSLLKIKPGTRLLDIATGRGQMITFARRLKAESYGIDFSMTACKIASVDSPETICCADALSLPFVDHYFDVVTNMGSLEHFENMQQAIREMVRVLRPDGLTCLMVPNSFGLRWNVLHAWKTGDVHDDGQPLQRYGTLKQWINLLEKNGLRLKRVVGYEHERVFPRTWNDVLNYLKKPRWLLSMLLIAPLIPTKLASQFVFICQVDEKNFRKNER